MYQVKPLIESLHCLETISKWLNKEFLYLNPGETVEERMVKMRDRATREEIPYCMVLFDEEKKYPMATASLLENDLELRPSLTPWLASVYTHTDYRGKGVGSFLCQSIVNEVKKWNRYEALYLYTPDQEAFYKRLGWQTEEKLIYMSHDVTVMKYILC